MISNLTVQLSLQQALVNQTSKDGENFFWTCDPMRELPIIVADSGPLSEVPVTVMDVFADTVQRCSSLPALAIMDHETKISRYLTWQEYWSAACLFARSLIAIGVKQGTRVAIFGFNYAEWAISYFGSIFAGAIPTGVYPTSELEGVYHIISHSDAQVVVVGSPDNLLRVLQIRERCPSIRQVIYFGESPSSSSSSSTAHLTPTYLALHGVVLFSDFCNLGCDIGDHDLASRMGKQRPGNCATLVYTSGSTGLPKAAMLSHDNIVSSAKSIAYLARLTCDDVFLSHLPLSHVAALVADMFAPMIVGACTFMAGNALLEARRLRSVIRAARPTIFFSVPRVFERLEASIRRAELKGPLYVKSILRWSRTAVSAAYQDQSRGIRTRWKAHLAKYLVLERVHRVLGFERVRALGSGGAPLNPSTQEFFLRLGLPLCSLYGLSETTGPACASLPVSSWFSIGSVGRPIVGMTMKVEEDGELLWKGRTTFMGYMNDAESTRACFDEDGWLKSGDRGETDASGLVHITGRSKELIVTAGGENVPPLLVECAIKRHLPEASSVVIVGDRRPYLTALITLRMTPHTIKETKNAFDNANANISLANQFASKRPTMLAPDVIESLMARTDAKDIAQLGGVVTESGSWQLSANSACVNPVIRKYIAKCIETANRDAANRVFTVKKFRILPLDFTIEGGELTATLKVRRDEIIKKYASLIENMYNEYETSSDVNMASGNSSFNLSMNKKTTINMPVDSNDSEKFFIGRRSGVLGFEEDGGVVVDDLSIPSEEFLLQKDLKLPSPHGDNENHLTTLPSSKL